MFTTIVVPLDGSAHAEEAIPYAIDEGRRHAARLLLVHIVTRPEAPDCLIGRGGPAPVQPQWPDREIQRETAEAAQYLSDVICRYRLGREARGVVAVGDPTKLILEEAGRHERPMIVLTTGDATEGARPPISEVARRLLIAGTVPVMGIRHAPADGDRGSGVMLTSHPDRAAATS